MRRFPAFKDALEYTAPTFNENTGWYLPSESEWMDMLGDNGLKVLPNGKFAEAKNQADDMTINLGNIAQTVAENLNAKLDKVGASNFDVFTLNQLYWSSSEHSYGNAYRVAFCADGNLYYYYCYNSGINHVRPVLAF